MARIKVIQYEEANNELKSVYDDLISKRGKLSEVLKIQSLHPASIKSHVIFYMDIMFSKTALTRAEKELIAVVVSVANGCLYCQTHHSAALNAYWKDERRIELLKEDYHAASLSLKETALCNFAIHLTQHPADHESINHTIALKDAGLTDEGILDVVLVTSYFNFVNRMVMALGVELENNKGEGFKY
ncbi:MAG TPA: peroxidase-related enzyme [Flavisolibacter sp.]|nr:peroxidase-related enzyme [Flavisolibacter sp.]